MLNQTIRLAIAYLSMRLSEGDRVSAATSQTPSQFDTVTERRKCQTYNISEPLRSIILSSMCIPNLQTANEPTSPSDSVISYHSTWCDDGVCDSSVTVSAEDSDVISSGADALCRIWSTVSILASYVTTVNVIASRSDSQLLR
ncbi:unnamed protein product [Dicrocoelium dendriticum]|nr:unnamed protein product [Dicrocoelium dendriticum]